MRTLALPEAVELWSPTSLRQKLVKIGARIVTHGRYVTFQFAEVAVRTGLFVELTAADRQTAATARSSAVVTRPVVVSCSENHARSVS